MWKDSETIIDYLNFDYIIDAVVKLVLDEDLSPSSIGLYGDWGSGKSSLMKMVEQHLISMNDKSILCIRFNGWLFEGYEDAKTALCGTILESIHKKEGLSSQVKGKVRKLWNKVDVQKILGKGIRYGLDYFMTGGVLSLTDFTISQITNALKKNAENVTEEDIAKALRSLKTDNNIRKDIKNFHDEFEKILKETNIKHLVVFIDELDRCSPETILDIIEAMRLFLFAKGTSFVIGADQRLIEYAIKTKYKEVIGNNLDIGREYMEKVIQYPVNIPALDENEVEQYISCLLLEKDLDKDEFAEIKELEVKEKEPKQVVDDTNEFVYENTVDTEIIEQPVNKADIVPKVESIIEDVYTIPEEPINGKTTEKDIEPEPVDFTQLSIKERAELLSEPTDDIMTEFNAYCKRMGYTEEKVRSIRYKMALYDDFLEEFNYRKKHYGVREASRIEEVHEKNRGAR